MFAVDLQAEMTQPFDLCVIGIGGAAGGSVGGGGISGVHQPRLSHMSLPHTIHAAVRSSSPPRAVRFNVWLAAATVWLPMVTTPKQLTLTPAADTAVVTVTE